MYIAKRQGIKTSQSLIIRGIGIVVAFLIAGILCTLISPGTFGTFFASMFSSTFASSFTIFNLLGTISIYLLLSLALAPVFKMKFWNIGAEGQALAGAIVAAVILLKLPSNISGPVVIIIAFVASVVAGAVWALIPTIFKLKFNTNETLFTLLLNYVAMSLASFTIVKCSTSATGKFPMIRDTSRLLTDVGGLPCVPFVIFAIVILVLMFFYLKKTKHGYELSVLGDSANTARYVGMNINKITIRTMIISGAIAGSVGFLLICGLTKQLAADVVKNRGFTAVLIAWLGHFDPLEIALYSAIIGFLDEGTLAAASHVSISGTYFPGLIIGIFILIVVVTEFFLRYQIKKRRNSSSKNEPTSKPQEIIDNFVNWIKKAFKKIKSLFKKKHNKKEAK